MLKFIGKASCFKEFMEKIKETLGNNPTLKEAILTLGAMRK